jgi:hypothetical protein
VFVLRSALVAVIAGGDRTVGKSSAFDLVGSSSNDPDGTATLTYIWSCIRGGSSYGLACALPSPLTNASTQTIPAGRPIGAYIFTMIIADPATGRSASATVTITIQSQDPPTSQIAALAVSKINPSSKVGAGHHAGPYQPQGSGTYRSRTTPCPVSLHGTMQT